MDFKNIDNRFRPLPFWSWNDKLKEDETKRQVNIMKNAGMGGFFMHARGGLRTEYMGSEWFSNIKSAIKEAKKNGMSAWAYDENGWPSGFGNGLVNGLGIEYQQKNLRMETEFIHKDTHIAKVGNLYFYYDVNPFYVDTLDKKVTDEFLDKIYKPYYEKFSNDFDGFFTDEPAVSRFGIPWSFVMCDEYKNRFNEDLISHLPDLFIDEGDYKKTRINFWSMVTDLFSENFLKRIYDWCDERGLKLTGHLVCEEELLYNNLPAYGSCMPNYEYFHIPGVDWLGRRWKKGPMKTCLAALQTASVAQQLGKEQVLTETYALCGHSITFAQMKGLMEWQTVRGVNLLCQHLAAYSLAGIRKRDYPPTVYYQQGWWGEYKNLVDALAREGEILSKGEKKVDVLLISPQTTAWTLYNTFDKDKAEKLNLEFLKTIDILEEKHIVFHIGDETIIKRHAKVENGKFIIGNQAYSTIIKENCDVLLPYTNELIYEFEKTGGIITTSKNLEKNNITDCDELTYTNRILDGKMLHFFVNSTNKSFDANINANGYVIDIFTGEKTPFCGKHTFEAWGSLLLIEDESVSHYKKNEENYIRLKGIFDIENTVENCITLDKCDYYFDGELQEKDGYVLNICERACKLQKKVRIHQDYHVNISYIPKDLFLVCETPENFIIKINGEEIDKTDCGYFVDASFRKINIVNYVKTGENILSFDCDFIQSDAFYEDVKNLDKFEGVRNKLVYDMEIEAIYLVGDFCVKTDGVWEEIENDALRYKGEFSIDKPVKTLELSDFVKQGFPFFCGELELTGTLKTEYDNPVLVLDMKGINAVKIQIDNKEYKILTNNKLKLSIKKGEYDIKVTIFNNLRNMLGPHHHENGDIYIVSPADFYKESGIWKDSDDLNWNDDYCFIKTSL